MRQFYPEFTWKKSSEKSIYLTFDDGPIPKVTPWVLKELDKVGAKASFFCLGKNLKNDSSLAKEMIKSGHTIGNHTYDHLNGWKSRKDSYLENVKMCDEILDEIDSSSNLFRPPYGRLTNGQATELKNKQIVMWSYISWDFAKKFSPDKSVNWLKGVSPGDIVLFHDSIKSFNNLKKILPQLLAFYTEKGFELKAL